MFSWSSSRKGPAPRYPGQQQPLPVAQTVQGSIRPPQSDLIGLMFTTRAQHLESYCNDATLQRSTRKVSSDDTTYDTVFQTTSGEALILRVYLPPLVHDAAPCRSPQMTLVGVKATHPWLDSRMRVVGYAAIQSDAAWKHSRLLLGIAVHEVVQHLQLNPPMILEMTDPGLAKLQQTMGATTTTSSAAAAAAVTSSSSMNQRQPQQPPDYDSVLNSMTPPNPVDMPSIPMQFPEPLDSLSREELQKLLSDELEFLTLVYKLPIYQETLLQRDSLLEENAKKAMSMLEREQEYTLLHGQVKDLQESLNAKLIEFEKLQHIQDELIRPPDPNQLKRELNHARKKAMDESEDYAMAWVEDGSKVTEFCKLFVERRNKMHLRAAKVERLEHMMRMGMM